MNKDKKYLDIYCNDLYIQVKMEEDGVVLDVFHNEENISTTHKLYEDFGYNVQPFIEKPTTTYIDDRELSLADMKVAVDGWIEVAFDDGETQIVCNEEGKIMGLPENEEATKLWYKKHHETSGVPMNDVLVGDVLVLTGKARMT